MARKEVLKGFILSWEGNYACVSGDKGSHTNKGITIGTFRSVFGQGKSVQDLKNMTESQWDYIYERLFWSRWKADEIKSQSIANLLVDWVWTSGNYGIRIPQSVLNVTSDGIVGAKTLAAINNYPNEKELFDKLWKAREAYFVRIGVREQKKFLNGWLNRLKGIRYGKLICNGGETINY